MQPLPAVHSPDTSSQLNGRGRRSASRRSRRGQSESASALPALQLSADEYSLRPGERAFLAQCAPGELLDFVDPLPGLLGYAGQSDQAFDPLTRPLADRFLIV